VTVYDKLKEISQLFSGIEAPAREAEILITETLGISKTRLHTAPLEISREDSEKIDLLSRRRIKGEPMNYIIGHVEFHGLRIHVGKGVLIPRPETELMVEEAVKLIKKGVRSQRSETSRQPIPAKHEPGITILDLCTGSGCIALALAHQLPQAVVCGVDASDSALSYALKNAEFNEIENVTFLKGDLLAPLAADSKFTCIISNPPYIRSKDIDKLQVEIRDFEPLAALDGGEGGLNFYRRIFKDAPRFLKDTGILIIEAGADQADDIRHIASEAGFSDFGFIRDYAGIERIFIGCRL
jgi:release factor glutamine methyltransferase